MRRTLLGLAGLFLLLANPLSSPAQSLQEAESRPYVWNTIGFCDTAEQAKRVMQLEARKTKLTEAINIVNAEVNNPTACVLAMVRYAEGRIYDTFIAIGVEYRVVHVIIRGILTPRGQQPLVPAMFFAILHERVDST